MAGILKVDEISEATQNDGVILNNTVKVRLADNSTQNVISTSGNTTTIDNISLGSNTIPNSSFMFRNKIINGDMSIAQRATPGGTAVTAGGKPVACDRWHPFGSGFGTYILSQSTDAPAGFANSLLIANTVSSSASGSDHFGLQYKFEGQEIQSFAKGNSAAQPVTVSWYSKTTNPGVYTIELDDRDNTRSISATFSATTTWTRHSVTFPGDTVGQLDNDTLTSVHLSWWLMAGSNFTSGTLQTAWDARTNANRVSSTNNNLSNGSSFYITGVQLEMGNTATPFEHRPLAMELTLCQRYYQHEVPSWGTPRHSDNVIHSAAYFKVTMRDTPTPTQAYNQYGQSVTMQSINKEYYVTLVTGANSSASSSLHVKYNLDAEL